VTYNWPKKPVSWVVGGRTHISVPFTWNLPAVRQAILDGNLYDGRRPVVGGPAVKLMPDYLADVAAFGEDWPTVLQRINPLATRTSAGCPRNCPFCGVRRICGDFREFDDWPNLPVICDDNLLACSRVHFDKVIDRLKGQKDVDFNQGLDARLLALYHADRIAELDCLVRMSWDDIRLEATVMRAIGMLRTAALPKSRIRCYVLIGFRDTPEDALYRVRTLERWDVMPNPMRYTPLDSLSRDYVDPNWTEAQLTRFMRYWSNRRVTTGVPFNEFGRERTQQEALL
jgi:hypothetical protein